MEGTWGLKKKKLSSIAFSTLTSINYWPLVYHFCEAKSINKTEITLKNTKTVGKMHNRVNMASDVRHTKC